MHTANIKKFKMVLKMQKYYKKNLLKRSPWVPLNNQVTQESQDYELCSRNVECNYYCFIHWYTSRLLCQRGATISNLKFIPPKVKNGHSRTIYFVGSQFNQMKQSQDNT